MLQAVLAAAEGETTNPLIPQWYDIIWSSVCFVVILIFFWRVALPRMKKLLDERSAAIEGNIEKADVAQREAEAALEQYTAQLAEARSEAAKIREQARADAQRIGSEINAQAQADAERVKANAQVAIEADRQAALVSLRSEVGSLAIDLASGVVGESLSDDAKATALVDRFLADLEASDTAGKK
ncbi:F0F1 ATP synthase subunit B [Herbiconiux sp.]|uniref:F0F1 ATP synthase subunit B n=1 Tax=Herbiconiux sp. TaxID=1871186 RepID=UPI0025C57EC3|nr:F0F1 ATP synthase subunit B [Herbiconiux sp.]